MSAEPRRSTVCVLWARSDCFPIPQFLSAWSEGLVKSFPEMYYEERQHAMQFFIEFGDDDGPWTFWTTWENVPTPGQIGEPIEPEVRT